MFSRGKVIRPKLHFFFIYIRFYTRETAFSYSRRDPPPPPPLRQRRLRLRRLVRRGKRLRQGRAIRAAEARHHSKAEVRMKMSEFV